MIVMLLCIPVAAHAQFGNILSSLKNNPAVAQLQGSITRAQKIAAIFAQMPLTQGKLQFVEAALPLLSQALVVSNDPAAAGKVTGILDKIKGLTAQKWSTAAIDPNQMPQAKTKIEEFGNVLKNLIQNESNSMKAALSQTVTK